MDEEVTLRCALAALLATLGLTWAVGLPIENPIDAPSYAPAPVAPRTEWVPMLIPGAPVVVRVSAPTPSVSRAVAACPRPPVVPAPPAVPRLTAAKIRELANTDWGSMFDHFSDSLGDVATAEGRPELAYVVSHGDSGGATVYLSRDNGRSYAAVLGAATQDYDDRYIRGTAFDCTGRLYALKGDALGVRDIEGRERWHGFPLAAHGDAWSSTWLTTVGPWVLWSMGDQLAASSDGGLTWRSLGDTYDLTSAQLIPTRRALYIQRTCTAGELCLDRISPETGERVALHVTLRYVPGEASMTATATPTGWQLGLRCPTNADGAQCVEHVSAEDQRWAAGLAPELIEGELRTHYEIQCTEATPNACSLIASDLDGKQVLAPAPPGYVVGVDGAGEPVATLYTQLLRWSPSRGWR